MGNLDKKNLHVLCAGGAGYIGSHTVVHLIAQGYKVSVLDNLSNSCKEVINRLEEITKSKIPFFEVDLRDKTRMFKLFEEERFDAVIHYAGLKAVGESVDKPLEYYDNNVGGTIILLQAMRKGNCNMLVFSSSCTVYKPSETPLTEECALGASNPYGQTKVVIEQILKDLNISSKELRVSILRYFNPVGAHPSGRIGESPDCPMNLLPSIQQIAVGRREILNVFGDDWGTRDGTGIRDYIHVEDLALGHLAALGKLLESPTGCCLIHNLGTGRGQSVLELKVHFQKACGKSIPHQVVGRRAGDLGSVICNTSKAEKELGWKATRTIEQACESSWKWQSMNPYGYSSPPDSKEASCGNTTTTTTTNGSSLEKHTATAAN